mmetsp:Transcript_5658/g.21420  ORF Transcript_5658/g.21420 Transcript_5658/m.21420 type:complete len:357 (+) Transcript_5658:90-1160(+)
MATGPTSRTRARAGKQEAAYNLRPRREKEASSAKSSSSSKRKQARPGQAIGTHRRQGGAAAGSEQADPLRLESLSEHSAEFWERASPTGVLYRMQKKMRLSTVYVMREQRILRAVNRRAVALRSGWHSQLHDDTSKLKETNTKLQESNSKLQEANQKMQSEVARERKAREHIEKELEDSRLAAEEDDIIADEGPDQQLDDAEEATNHPAKVQGRPGRSGVALAAKGGGKPVAAKAKPKPKPRGRPGGPKAALARAGGSRAVPASTSPSSGHAAVAAQVETDPEDLAADPGPMPAPRPLLSEAATPSLRALSGGASPIMEFVGAPVGKGAKVPTGFWTFPPTEPQRPVTRSAARGRP